jgi:hypothetical protein
MKSYREKKTNTTLLLLSKCFFPVKGQFFTCVCEHHENGFSYTCCLRYIQYRSGKSASRDRDEDFKDNVQEQEEPLLDSPETSTDDSESSDERRNSGAGLLFGAAAAGIISYFQSFSNMFGRSAGNDSDDLHAVLSEAVDVDDVKTSMTLGSDACKASMEPTGNGFGASNVSSSTPVTPPPGVESAA